MTAWAERAAKDPSLRASGHQRRREVVLRRGRPGVDGEDGRLHREENIRDARAAATMFSAIDTLPMPVIARVHGAALGGGAGLAAVADIAVAAATPASGSRKSSSGLLPGDHRAVRAGENRSARRRANCSSPAVDSAPKRRARSAWCTQWLRRINSMRRFRSISMRFSPAGARRSRPPRLSSAASRRPARGSDAPLRGRHRGAPRLR